MPAKTPESKRLAIVFADYGGTQEGFAKLLETSRSNVMRMISGETPVSIKVIKIVCFKLGYSPEWFIMGTGPKKSKGQDGTKLVTEVQLLRTEMDIMLNKNKQLEARMKAYEDKVK